MKKLLAGLGVALLSSFLPVHAGNNEGWALTGLNRKGEPEIWLKLRNAELVNADSVKVMMRVTNQRESLLTINCANKDFQRKWKKGLGHEWTEWLALPQESLSGQILCRHTDARDKWKMTKDTAHLWNAAPPEGSPGDASGEWIEHSKTDKLDYFYNDDVKTDGNVAIYAVFQRQKELDLGEGTSMTKDNYYWVIMDCKKNKYSTWWSTQDGFFKGFWSAPNSETPDGSGMVVKRKFCSTPNTTFASAKPIPTIETLRKFAD